MKDRSGEKCINEYDVIVVGAGAAGQMAAIAAAEESLRVAVFEQMPRAGLKIIASGGGRANITNMVEPAEFESAFGRQGRFISPAMNAMPPDALREFFRRLGVPTVVDDELRVYPASQRAVDIETALLNRMESLGVVLRCGCGVGGLMLEDGRLAGVELSDGGRAKAPAVVLACGGKSYPALGGTGTGYRLAGQAGHTIVEPTPSLVPLVTRESWLSELAGVAVRGVRVRIAMAKQSKAGVVGDVLFTHRGLSGPAVLNISGDVAALLARGKAVPLQIELAAGMDAAAWQRELESWRSDSGQRRVVNLLQRKLPGSLCSILCEQAGISEDVTAAELPADCRDRLAGLLGGLEITVTGTEGFDAAFVTRGGVKLKEVSPDTMESRKLPGLYIAGELLDLDGPTGGYNLQWAFASGHLAGESAAKKAGTRFTTDSR